MVDNRDKWTEGNHLRYINRKSQMSYYINFYYYGRFNF